MVSFSCEVCNDTVQKKKLDQHKQRCYGAYYTCIDCSVTFQNTDYRNHTSCISEAEKYEKGLYRGKKKAQEPKKEQPKLEVKKVEVVEEKVEVKVKDDKKSKKEKSKSKSKSDSKSKSKTKASDFSAYVSEPTTLYKVAKAYSAATGKDTKHVMKNLSIQKNENGDLVVKLI